MKFCFGDIVVVEDNLIGVVVKSWVHSEKASTCNSIRYEVYVRMYNEIKEYREEEIERYMVRHKYLDDEEMEYQSNAIHAKDPFHGMPEDIIKQIQELVKEFVDEK